jgi:hypothetical protein
MARYIDADKLIDTIFPIGMIDDGKYTINAGAINRAIDSTPTADVVPRAEFAVRAFHDAATIYGLQEKIKKLNAEVAREIILEIDTLICCHANGDIDDKRLYILFDQLKKKYIGGEQNNEN